MSKEDKLRMEIAANYAVQLDLDTFKLLDESLKLEILSHFEHLNDYFDQFKNAWPTIPVMKRVHFYQRLPVFINKWILESDNIFFPLNIDSIEKTIGFMNYMISINQGTTQERAVIEINTPQFKKLAAEAQNKIDKIIELNFEAWSEREAKQFGKLFKDVSGFNHIMETLIEKRLIAQGTYQWIHLKSGWKTFLVSIIKVISINGFLKQKHPLTDRQIEIIAKEHFGVKISFSLITQHHLEKVSLKDLEFIPLESTIKK